MSEAFADHAKMYVLTKPCRHHDQGMSTGKLSRRSILDRVLDLVKNRAA